MNAVAETSMRAFVNGLDSLSQRRREAADAVFKHPNMTGRELEALTGKRKINARLPEVEERGFIVRNPLPRICTITGFEAMTWRARLAGESFTKPQPTPSWKMRTERAEAKLIQIDLLINAPGAEEDRGLLLHEIRMVLQ